MRRNLTALALLGVGITAAQDRVVAPRDPNQVVTLKGHLHPKARPQNDQGPIDPSTELSYLTLLLKPQASLELFLAEQQNPASPNYHRWLTPDQFADRFGVSGDDVNRITAWLQSQGLRVHDVARGRHWITFSGTAGQTARAFHTEIHRYRVDGETHFANATDPSVPASLENLASSITGLNDFKLRPMSLRSKLTPEALGPDFNSGRNHFLAPDDVATIYNIKPLSQAGFDGTGQKLVVVGQTSIALSDIRAFRRRFNLPAKDPQLIRVGPDPGISPDDLPEADLDIEWAGAIAPNATIIYVYSESVDISAQYAVDQNLAPVISMSYGGCELESSPAYRAIVQQANAQGITWMVSSGDAGAATCDFTSPTPQAAKGLTTDFPASIPEVTAVGGTTFNEGNGSYWASSNGPNGGSALSYIPEKVWNDSLDRNGFASSGGGASALFAKPFWQKGPGVPSDNARDVPDIALAASPDHDGYLVSTLGGNFVFGGTSVGTPVFAGIVTLLNQYLVSKGVQTQPGLGNINPTLYRLAQATTDIFHDITDGDNSVACVQGSPDCINGLLGYSARPGYDLATGLGSIDAHHLATEWSTGAASKTTLSANPTSFGLGDKIQLTATVVAVSGTTTPTGTVTFIGNDLPLGTVGLTLSAGVPTATLTVAALLIAGGNGTLTVFYGGDNAFLGSGASATVSLKLPATGSSVVPSVTPNPVTEILSLWPYDVRLTEKAGVATKLTGFTINGVNQNLNAFGTTTIPANGSISASLAAQNIVPPLNRTFHFTGVDANGATWAQDITVPFVGPAGPPFKPTMSLTSTPAVVLQNPQADASCQWSQQLTVQEQAGFYVLLTNFLVGTSDFSSSIQQAFGTTRLAPFGTLHADICWSGTTPPTPKNFGLAGESEVGTFVSAVTSSTFGPAASNAASLSVTPPVVEMLTDSAPTGASTSVALNFAGGTPQWTASVAPLNRTSSWLTVSPLSGAGPATLNIQAAGGLSKGVYDATLVIQSANSIPQSISVRVILVVGTSSSTSISDVVNAASSTPAFAPGMSVNVLGSGLAPSSQKADGFPLPFIMDGVSATVNGVSAPLYSVSPGNINLQIPYETGSGMAILGINNNGTLASHLLPISVVAPRIFTAQNGFLDRVANGSPGQTLTAFVTGDGDLAPFLATGATPPPDTRLADLPRPLLPVSVTVGGVPGTIRFIGIPSGLVGVTQINFTIPLNAPPGVQPLVVTVGGVGSAPAYLRVSQ